MKFNITATIPTAQYANLQPSIEVEADTFEEARAIAMPQIQSIWNSVCEPGKELAIRGTNAPTEALKALEAMKCTFSGEVVYIDSDHNYTDDKGNKFLSGSRFAKQWSRPFPKEAVLPMYAKKWDETPATIDAYWSAKSKASTDFGHALHQALETYGKFAELTKKLNTPEKPVTVGVHPLLLPTVEDFFADRFEEEALYEVFVVDKAGLRCGQIDRLVKTGEKTCIIEDYKTNRDLRKQGVPKFLLAPFDGKGKYPLLNQALSEYYLQLNFYREIVESLGWKVEAMKIHYFGEDFEEIAVPVIDLKSILSD